MSSVPLTSAICSVCPHSCRIPEGKLGLCGARACENGKIVSKNFGEATALALDPIEKKPLARFHPGSLILSYGSYGCNLRCSFCQNSDISMETTCGSIAQNAVFVSPGDLVQRAKELAGRGNIGVALTYNEPLIAPEYLIDVGRLLHKENMQCVVVTNGYVTKETLEPMLPYIDAMNIDLKCFTEEGYRSVSAPQGLETVKQTIALSASAGVHVEITTLVVPGLSDDPKQLEQECEWIASINKGIPLHLSRFFPRYKMLDEAPTERPLLAQFEAIAKRYLEYVYLGNV